MHEGQHVDMLLNYIVNATVIQEFQKAKMDTSGTVQWLSNSIQQKCQRLNNNQSVIQIVKVMNGTYSVEKIRENGKDKHDDVFDKI